MRVSKACSMALAKAAPSSLLLKFIPHTCRGSLHWWKFGVAWLYFIPFRIGQFITTCWSACSLRPTTLKVLAEGLW